MSVVRTIPYCNNQATTLTLKPYSEVTTLETSVISENSITDMNSRLYALGLPPCRPCEIKELISKIGNDAFNRSISTIHYDASSYRSIARGIVTVDIPRRNPLYTPLLNIEDKAKEEGMDLLEEAEKALLPRHQPVVLSMSSIKKFYQHVGTMVRTA